MSNLIFEEYFQDNRNNWSICNSSEYATELSDNAYVFEHKREHGSWLAWNYLDSNCFHLNLDFHMHVVLEKIEGVDGEHGIIWGLSDVNNFIDFVISDRFFKIRRNQDGNWTTYASGQIVGQIHQPNGIDILEIRRTNDLVEFYLNSLCVSQLAAEILLPGMAFGLVVYNRLKIKVHSIVIATPATIPEAIRTEPTMPNAGSSQTDKKLQANCIEHYPPEDDTLDRVFADLHELIGHDRTKQQFLTFSNFLKVQTERQIRGLGRVNTSLHMCLCGPPGTGKTMVSRLVGRLYKQLGCLKSGHTIEVDRAGLIGGYIGQTALRVEDAIERALDGVLFIDEAHILVGDSDNDFGHEAIQILLKRMEDSRDRLAVIMAGYSSEMVELLKSNPGLKSRFHRQFHLDRYTPTELTQIFAKFCREHDYMLDLSARLALQAIFEDAYSHQLDRTFGNGRFVRTIFERSIERHANRVVHSLPDIDDRTISLITAEDLEQVES
ncbi:AAA family ATPase [Chamaesiphon polymorphus]|uniref:AAA family ATPase n=1 Tax=Chamaesiphon polymorphus CCALA 037 TaxID=2107692 RepID=A0A2T1FZ55_9CYAN|nr:AAA family ATPase [Chamaesiphon polymorphus]PSB50283.1 AAA family ATPase [Chamaesiphon polymorphus CCALA 037]